MRICRLPFCMVCGVGANCYRWTRHNFDYIILGLVVVYGFSFGMFVFAHMRLRSWVLFLRIIWPCLIATDLVCFISGWIATWRDVSSAPLGV